MAIPCIFLLAMCPYGDCKIAMGINSKFTPKTLLGMLFYAAIVPPAATMSAESHNC